jgi:type I restriction enzyme M protein
MLFSEKDVELKVIQPLFKDILGYDDNQMSWAYPVSMNEGRDRKSKEADLVIKINNKPVIVVEAKKLTESVKSGVSQVDSYAFWLGAKYSLIINGKTLVLRGYYEGNTKITIIEESLDSLKKSDYASLRDIIAVVNILNSSKQKINRIEQPDESKIRDFRRFFRKIHNIIRDNDKLDPSASFDEFSKILFLKASEERGKSSSLTKLTLEKIEEMEKEPGDTGEKINSWFQSITQQFYPNVFEKETKLNLSVGTIKEVLEKMEGVSITAGDVDVKGRAFEEFLPSQLRGKGLGQFFTPRPIVNFMVNLADLSIYDTVIDFACGSGGFLIKAFEEMKLLTEEMPNSMWHKIGIEKKDFLNNLKSQQIYGIDAEPRAARTAKINMIMWGDGERITRGNSLDFKDLKGNKYGISEFSKTDVESGCTVILANPPFGEKEKSEEILKQYELGGKNKNKKTEKTEILFIERGLRLLRPQGKMLIVLPLGILTNPSYKHVREYIHKNSEIKAVITLPTHTFVQSGVDTIKTCILFLEKFTEEKSIQVKKFLEKQNIDGLLKSKDFNYKIFMGKSEFVGFEPSGRIVDLAEGEETDLDRLYKDFFNDSFEFSLQKDLVNFANKHYSYKQVKKGVTTQRGTKKDLKESFLFELNDLEDRIDPEYYIWKNNINKYTNDFIPVGEIAKESSLKFLPTSDDEIDKEYPYLSVTNDGLCVQSDFLSGDKFTQKYKIVKPGDIVYNPYRVNIGSIGLVTKTSFNAGKYDFALVSPAYVVFKSEIYDNQFLIDLLRSPFYKLYIDILSTGSIRDSFSYDILKGVKIPNIKFEEQNKISREIQDFYKKIQHSFELISKNHNKANELIHDLLTI